MQTELGYDKKFRLDSKREGWGKLTGFIKDWGGFGAAVAIIMFFIVQWTSLTEFRVNTNDRLDSIEKRLLILRASESPDKVFRELNSLDQNRFSQVPAGTTKGS
jgi:hypothetical protein